GARIDRNKLRRVLVDANRTIEDLKRHVELISERRQAVADRDEADSLEAQLPNLRKAVEDSTSAVKAMQEKHRAELAPLKEASGKAADAAQASKIEAASLRTQAQLTLNRTLPKANRILGEASRQLSETEFADPLLIDWK